VGASPLGKPNDPNTGLDRKPPRLVVIALLVPTGTWPFRPNPPSSPPHLPTLATAPVRVSGRTAWVCSTKLIEPGQCIGCFGLAHDGLEYLGYLRYNTGQHGLRVHRALPPQGAALLISPILQEALDTFHETRSHPIGSTQGDVTAALKDSRQRARIFRCDLYIAQGVKAGNCHRTAALLMWVSISAGVGSCGGACARAGALGGISRPACVSSAGDVIRNAIQAFIAELITSGRSTCPVVRRCSRECDASCGARPAMFLRFCLSRSTVHR